MNPLVRRALGTACAATVTLGLTAGLAPSAYAEKLVRTDPRHDVTKILSTTDDDVRPAPRASDPDIVRVAVDHRPRVLLVRTEYRALTRRVLRVDVIEIRTRSRQHFSATSVVARKGHWQGETFLEGRTAEGDIPCAGLRHRFDYANDVVTWTIPRSCIGRPRWVRVGIGAARGSESYFIDDAFRRGFDPNNEDLVLSRRIWRG